MNIKNIRQNWHRYVVRMLIWRGRHISDRAYLMFLGALVGLFAGFAAVLLKSTVHFIQIYLSQLNYDQIFYPVLGLLATVALGKMLKDKLGHGITDILHSIMRKSSFIEKKRMYSRMLTSSLTVGFGGSVGLETPIVITGAAIGANMGLLIPINQQQRTLLIGCGVAGVISAIFNAPVGGVIFALEVILTQVALNNFIPLLISSVAAKLVSMAFLGDDVVFSFHIRDKFVAADVPFTVLLGVVCAFVAMFFGNMTEKIPFQMQRISNVYLRACVGGFLLSLIIFIFPPIYGEGYSTILALLKNNEFRLFEQTHIFSELPEPYIFVLFLIAMLLFKILATAITLGAGGSGGIFAPSLFVGAMTGFIFARLVNMSQLVELSESNFTLLGMGAVMSGVQYAPLAAIFLMAELTEGYTLFVPLMLVSAISFSVASFFNPNSPYIRELIRRGFLGGNTQDQKVLSLLTLNNGLIEKDFVPIASNSNLGELTHCIKHSRRSIFPVLDKEDLLCGIVLLDDVREIMFDTTAYSTPIEQVMTQAPACVEVGESMANVMACFDRTGAWNLPVTQKGKYIGFISKSRIFNAYRDKLKS